MPSYRGHLLFGYLILGIAYFLQINRGINLHLPTELTEAIIVVIIVGIYSLLPDCDIGTSKASKWLTRIALTTIIFLSYKQENYLVIAVASLLLIVAIAKHRGLTHSFFSGVFFASPLWFVDRTYFILAFISFGLHLVADKEFNLLPRKI